jgi:hypothetical protein
LVFSLCFELHASEFFDEQPLFENLLKLEDSNGQTVLYHAIRSGDKDCVELLLFHNMSPVVSFRPGLVQRSACFCGFSTGTCVCQPSHNIFPFLIMSLDLSQLYRFICQKPPQSPRKAIGHLHSHAQGPTLSILEARGIYRILDTDLYTFSYDDSKKMWRRCMDNILFFHSPTKSKGDRPATEGDNPQFSNELQMHMSIHPLQHEHTHCSGSLQLFSSFKNAMTVFDKSEKDKALPGVPFVNVESVAKRFMFFAFSFFSNGSKTGFRDIIEEMNKLTTSTQEYLTHVKIGPLFQNKQLNNTSSALFVLANSMFNCGVALKMSHCTQARHQLFFEHDIRCVWHVQ